MHFFSVKITYSKFTILENFPFTFSSISTFIFQPFHQSECFPFCFPLFLCLYTLYAEVFFSSSILSFAVSVLLPSHLLSIFTGFVFDLSLTFSLPQCVLTPLLSLNSKIKSTTFLTRLVNTLGNTGERAYARFH